MKALRKGFTIVELVIVIAVIAILAAVLIPTFSGVVNNANRSARQQEMTNALKVVLASNAATGALSSGTTFILSEKDGNSYIPAYYSVYNGNKLGDINVCYTKNDNTKTYIDSFTYSETLSYTKVEMNSVIIGYDGTNYDSAALEAIKYLYGLDDAITVNNGQISIVNSFLTVYANTDLPTGTFVLVP